MVICGSGSELPVRKTDDYDWAEDAVATQALRERYFEERLPGESVKEWLEQMGQ